VGCFGVSTIGVNIVGVVLCGIKEKIMSEKKIKLTKEEMTFINNLKDELYDAKYIEGWLNRKDVTVFNNAPAALICAGVAGFYRACIAMMRMQNN